MTIEERCKETLKRTFYASGKSEEEIANEMKITRRTLYNWLYGTSFPTFPQTIKWFIVTKQRMLPWLTRMQYLEKDAKIKQKKLSETQIEEELISFMKELSPTQKERLHHIFCADHGSAPGGILEMVDAHIHTPLRDRFKVASMILLNYEMARSNNELVLPEEAPPNVIVLEESIAKGREAILHGYDHYIMGEEK